MDRILTQTSRNAKLTLKVTIESYMVKGSYMTHMVLLWLKGVVAVLITGVGQKG